MHSDLRYKLRKIGITPTKTLGQNFLIDENIADKIVISADISEDEVVLEIGPGLGMLTDRMVNQVGELILVEKDEKIYSHLQEKYKTKKDLTIINDDVLEIDLPYFDKIVSNLPFSISSPITFKVLEQDFELGVLTYQKEYADRLIAQPGEENYSRLSVMTSTFADVEKLFDISKECFYPRPRVNATVVKLIPREPDFELRYPRIFTVVVRELFNYRRKMIRNALKTGFNIKGLEDVPYDDRRVGNLTPEQINEITEYLLENDKI